MEKKTERREHQRYRVKEDALVISPEVVGQITDISLGGMAFRYADKTNSSQLSEELDMFLSNDDFYLDSVPFTTVSDRTLLTVSPYSSMAMRHCGVQFGQLSPSQKSQLEQFIESHTNGAA